MGSDGLGVQITQGSACLGFILPCALSKKHQETIGEKKQAEGFFWYSGFSVLSFRSSD